jgi:hypothetical protein
VVENEGRTAIRAGEWFLWMRDEREKSKVKSPTRKPGVMGTRFVSRFIVRVTRRDEQRKQLQKKPQDPGSRDEPEAPSRVVSSCNLGGPPRLIDGSLKSSRFVIRATCRVESLRLYRTEELSAATTTAKSRDCGFAVPSK